jgi:glycosyltransferase involved in cell wall biosynthesis
MGIIVYPPTIDWSWMMQRPQQLMKQFARSGHRVFYCNKTVSARPVEETEPGLFIVHDHEAWVREELPRIRKETGGNVGVWCTFPKLHSTLARYQPDWIVYDCVDDFPEWLPYEREMVRMADIVVCTAERLYRRLSRQYPGKRIELVRNAYDPDMGLHLPPLPGVEPPLPPDLPDRGTPIAGYVGAWAPWIDEPLLYRLAAAVPEAEIVVIGAEFGRRFHPGRGPDNIRYLGMKPHDELAAYIRAFSVCLIPFRLTPVTLATNPVKAYEYLASGKPVVATDMPECRMFAPLVDTGRTPEEFITHVRRRLREPGDAWARTAFALENTWAHRFRQVERILPAF